MLKIIPLLYYELSTPNHGKKKRGGRGREGEWPERLSFPQPTRQ